jgi:hypothetical protein
MRYTPMRCTPVRYTPMRHTPVRYTLVRCTSVRCTPMRCTPKRHTSIRYTLVTPVHQMYACGMHAREVQINHKRPYAGGRDLSCKIRIFALRDKRSLLAAARRNINDNLSIKRLLSATSHVNTNLKGPLTDGDGESTFCTIATSFRHGVMTVCSLSSGKIGRHTGSTESLDRDVVIASFAASK